MVSAYRSQLGCDSLRDGKAERTPTTARLCVSGGDSLCGSTHRPYKYRMRTDQSARRDRPQLLDWGLNELCRVSVMHSPKWAIAF
jgi:hypothetical protein